MIAFTQPGVGGTQIFTISPDGGGLRQLTSEGTNTFPAWSRDGSRIAFSSTRSGTEEIWSMNADGSNQSQITFGTLGGNFNSEWSPDGTQIAYTSLQASVGHPEIWVMNSDGSNQVQITNGNGVQFPDSNASEWSRDGSTVAFWSGFETQFGEIWVMDPNGTNKRKLTETTDPFNSDNPVWSPDGSKILFDTNQAGPVELWVMDADGANPTALVATSGGPASWQPLSPPPATPVPATSRWGLAVIALLLAVASALVRKPTCRYE